MKITLNAQQMIKIYKTEKMLNESVNTEIEMNQSEQSMKQEQFFDDTLPLSLFSDATLYFSQAISRYRESDYIYCRICTVFKPISKTADFFDCKHKNYFCEECMMTYFYFRAEHYFELQCPYENCNHILVSQSEKAKKLPQFLLKGIKHIEQNKKNKKDIHHWGCLLEGCKGRMIFKKSILYCTSCLNEFCLDCLSKSHEGECHQEIIDQMQKKLGLRRCNTCGFLIEKREGCNKVICICGGIICYSCNETYTYTHVCKVDASKKVIMSFPTFPKDPKNKLSEEKKKAAEELGIVPCIYLTVTFLIYALASIAAFIIVLIAARTLLLLAEIAVGSIAMVGVGIGPFTLEFLKKKSAFAKCILVLLLPLTILVGIYKSLKTLFMPLFRRVLILYKLDLTLKIRQITDPILEFD